eukprot:TRINITY_DN4090_c0_g1_i2.p1 TRINITY_DN4090_c0_g1~~TRINITY_DN4090_c0_g1_i2.p1  ORF type:complete len:1170 (-),score=198.55 TRINITY_DN4090_c0_g1_i2:126-3635(-)
MELELHRHKAPRLPFQTMITELVEEIDNLTNEILELEKKFIENRFEIDTIIRSDARLEKKMRLLNERIDRCTKIVKGLEQDEERELTRCEEIKNTVNQIRTNLEDCEVAIENYTIQLDDLQIEKVANVILMEDPTFGKNKRKASAIHNNDEQIALATISEPALNSVIPSTSVSTASPSSTTSRSSNYHPPKYKPRTKSKSIRSPVPILTASKALPVVGPNDGGLQTDTNNSLVSSSTSTPTCALMETEKEELPRPLAADPSLQQTLSKSPASMPLKQQESIVDNNNLLSIKNEETKQKLPLTVPGELHNRFGFSLYCGGFNFHVPSFASLLHCLSFSTTKHPPTESKYKPQTPNITCDFSYYLSPLLCLRSYRLAPQYLNRCSYTSLTMNNKINPAHIYDPDLNYSLNDQELLLTLSLYREDIYKQTDKLKTAENFVKKTLEKFTSLSASIEEVAKKLVSEMIKVRKGVIYSIVRHYQPAIPLFQVLKRPPSPSPPSEIPTEAIQLLKYLKAERLTSPVYEGDETDEPSPRYFVGLNDSIFHNLLISHPNDPRILIEGALQIVNGSISNLDRGYREIVLQNLAKALEVNPKSLELWVLFLHLSLLQRDPTQVHELFEDCLQFCPTAVIIWRMYVRRSKFSVEEKIALCERAVASIALSEAPPSKEMFYLLIEKYHLISMSSKKTDYFSSDKWKDQISFLDSMHQATLTLHVIYRVLFGNLPSQDIGLDYITINPIEINFPTMNLRSSVNEGELVPDNLLVAENVTSKLQTMLLEQHKKHEKYSQLIPVCYALIESKLAEKNLGDGRLFCQLFLSAQADVTEFWALYACVEQRIGSLDEKEMLYEKGIAHYPKSLPLWYCYACSALDKLSPSKEKSTKILIRCSQGTQGVNTQLKDVAITEQTISQARQIFRKMCVETKKDQAYVFVWLIFCLFELLVDGIDGAHEIFNAALANVFSHLERSRLWLEYLRLEAQIGNFEGLKPLLLRIKFEDLTTSTHEFDLSDWTRLDKRFSVVVADYCQKDRDLEHEIVKIILDKETSERTLFMLREIFPSNLVALHKAWGFYSRSGCLGKAKEALIESLLISQSLPDAWHNLAKIEETDGHLREAHLIYRSGLQYNPHSFDLWRNFIAFERRHGDQNACNKLIREALKWFRTATEADFSVESPVQIL